MRQVLFRLLLMLLVITGSTRAAEPPLVVTGDEQKQIDLSLPDGGLPALPGVANIQVFRASRAAPELTDGRGWTYHHHVDLACWKGRLYLAWNTCEKDEDVWPSRELYSTSTDGMNWEAPRELFPAGLSTAQRDDKPASGADRGGGILHLRSSVARAPPPAADRPHVIRHYTMCTFTRLCFTFLGGAVLLAGCTHVPRNAPAGASAGKADGARLTCAEVIRIANQAAEREGIDISRYNEPEAHYEFTRKDKTWFVAFDGRVAMPGNHFSVSVDDQTGEARVFRGR